ncbi:MAG: LytR family transcriptional regulator [Ruminococcaceae bacterium]|nr:LytR family transcriptional regulator [Oscillospiraceae bacterium]
MENNTPEKEVLTKPEVKNKKKGGKIILAVLLSIVVLLALLVAALVISFFVMRNVGKNSFEPTVVDPVQLEELVEKEELTELETFDGGKTVTWRGKKYLYNENIVPVAFMGIDDYDLEAEDADKGAGQADTNMVMAFNTKTGDVSMIVIPRDAMADVEVYSEDGTYAGIQKMQLCLAYSYGDGEDTSCENVVTSMERLLCGIEISNYASLNLRGIQSLNNAVGGVYVVAIEDIGEFVKGETYYLIDDAARDYIQRRDTTKFNSDALRRERQLQFAKAFAKKAVEACLADFSTVTKLYNAAMDYTCTNITLSEFTYLASTVLENKNINFDNIYVLEGEAVMGDRFMEVHLDAENVLETVLEVFYTEVEE